LKINHAGTYITKEVEIKLVDVKASVPPAGDDLQYQDTEAIDIGFHRENAIQCIFRGHVAAEDHQLTFVSRKTHILEGI
jgi:hypothetical protein